MQKTTFQIAIMGVFIFAIIVAVMVFSGVIPVPGGGKQGQNLVGDIVIWGTLPDAIVTPLVGNISKITKTYSITYKEKTPEDFETDLVQALARGKGPDMVLFDSSLIVKHADKVMPIPYTSLSQRDFKNMYVEGAEFFMSPNGTLAVPLTVDPLVMYYNRDILADAGIVSAPSYWNEFLGLAPQLSKVDESGTLTRNMVALGEFDNVNHAKDITSLLLLQLGNPIVSATARNSDGVTTVSYASALQEPSGEGLPVGQSALRFYTQFSDPAKQTYSWNKTFPSARNMFISGKLSFYFGYASEYALIQQKNPHLNFDINRVPQVKDYPTKATVGTITGIAILKTTKNSATAYNTAVLLSSPESVGQLASSLSIAPARRDLLAQKQTDAINSIIYPSALISKTWLDPDSKKSDEVFRRLITSIVSGKASLSEAISGANTDLQDLLQ